MEMGHGDFVSWSFTDRLEQFSANLRWPGWQEVAAVRLDQGISVFPFPFTSEGHDLALVSRRPVPIEELLDLWEHLAEQLDGVRDGDAVRFRTDHD
jgi:hypothetical protein